MPKATHADLEREVAKLLPAHVTVEVTEWAGCDEPWTDPVYVTAEAPEEMEEEYYDAVCDLASAPLDEQARYVAEQLVQG